MDKMWARGYLYIRRGLARIGPGHTAAQRYPRAGTINFAVKFAVVTWYKLRYDKVNRKGLSL